MAYFDVVLAPRFGADGFESSEAAEEIKRIFKEAGIADPSSFETAEDYRKAIEERSAAVAGNPVAKHQLLAVLDLLWMTNLEDLEALSESVGLRAYGQKDPLVEYRQEASRLFKAFWGNFNAWIFGNMFKIAGVPAGAGGMTVQSGMAPTSAPAALRYAGGENESGKGKIGRNDPCPCGSGKKWKKCGLLNTEEHQKNMAMGGKKHEVTGG